MRIFHFLRSQWDIRSIPHQSWLTSSLERASTSLLCAPEFPCVTKQMPPSSLTWRTSKTLWISEQMTMVLGFTMAYGVCGYQFVKTKLKFSVQKKRPKCQLSGGAKLYCLRKAYHALKSFPDFRRLIATLEGMNNIVICTCIGSFDDYFQRSLPACLPPPLSLSLSLILSLTISSCCYQYKQRSFVQILMER